eukprot:COSAG01_NODE_287_length_19408_cov_231.791703_8_plen_65_part_00
MCRKWLLSVRREPAEWVNVFRFGSAYSGIRPTGHVARHRAPWPHALGGLVGTIPQAYNIELVLY